jgi:hypothetical protein
MATAGFNMDATHTWPPDGAAATTAHWCPYLVVELVVIIKCTCEPQVRVCQLVDVITHVLDVMQVQEVVHGLDESIHQGHAIIAGKHELKEAQCPSQQWAELHAPELRVAQGRNSDQAGQA